MVCNSANPSEKPFYNVYILLFISHNEFSRSKPCIKF